MIILKGYYLTEVFMKDIELKHYDLWAVIRMQESSVLWSNNYIILWRTDYWNQSSMSDEITI